MNEMTHRPSIEAPQLRTLLLTDLCDSTTLVERIGDVQAATLFRDHDRLVLDLQQRWRGRLIDRSDGLLLLFERPIDGLGFALDYVRELREMGDARRLELRARAGLHVGEVLTWRNSDEAVQVGAKPLEVEGLAKPMAARLMAMARPGQILLSAVAEPLAHRAARELGERGQHLLWKSHGRWRFKGVPDGQQIYEVGEPGIAPLRMPPNTPKAWRDLPLWRRPAALAAEAAIIAGIGVGVWFATRPAPAIAFNQRDWVVVADLRNLTGQSVLDDSLEQAFRISLEQSRYVNVLSDLKARDTLARMQLKPDTILDRAIASEIALRDGARAVILPTVAEVGGKVRVSAEIIDPHTQTTIYAESNEGVGADSTLTSIDAVTSVLRERLGEQLASIKDDSAPLPTVTTGSLDALRAFGLGQRSLSRGDYDEAQQFFERATALDPKFALAWLGQVRVTFGREDLNKALVPLREAQKFRDHLAPRERMYLDAWSARFDAPAKAAAKWIELAKVYPDYHPAQGNAALWLYEDNRYEEALPYAKAATSEQYEYIGSNLDILGRLQLATEKYADASASFDRAVALGRQGSLRRQAALSATQRRYDSAEKALQKVPLQDLHGYIEKVSVAVDRADWNEAQKSARTALRMAEEAGGFDARAFLIPAATASWLADDESGARRMARQAAERAILALNDSANPYAEDDAALAIGAALIALRVGDDSVAAKVEEALQRQSSLMVATSLRELSEVMRAARLRAQKKPNEALALLRPYLTGNERYQTRVVLMHAAADAGEFAEAVEHAQWLQRKRGAAFMELKCGQCLQALNVADSNIAALLEAQFLKKMGKANEADAKLKSFDAWWATEALPSYLRTQRESAVTTSRLGTV
ncbi:putative peptide modification system cyclase [Lysobacter soli]|uniref:putative peptide modification system cyclase n=1 Tax=Lysobacter soli TaxID=453783 RepID=UPI0012ED58C0|nr:putative peptide modification system cyclase [Lysobacter soli]QGW66611.1 putative peptide modification system cyclase [Lysobacter soli]